MQPPPLGLLLAAAPGPAPPPPHAPSVSAFLSLPLPISSGQPLSPPPPLPARPRAPSPRPLCAQVTDLHPRAGSPSLPKSEPAEFPRFLGTKKKKKKRNGLSREGAAVGWGTGGTGGRGDLGRICKPQKFLLSLQNCRGYDVASLLKNKSRLVWLFVLRF